MVLGKLVPRLVGQDPTEIEKINELMDTICPHVSYAKSVIDIACWDIFGKVCFQVLIMTEIYQKRIQDFPEGDASPGGGANLLFGQIFPKTA